MAVFQPVKAWVRKVLGDDVAVNLSSDGASDKDPRSPRYAEYHRRSESESVATFDPQKPTGVTFGGETVYPILKVPGGKKSLRERHGNRGRRHVAKDSTDSKMVVNGTSFFATPLARTLPTKHYKLSATGSGEHSVSSGGLTVHKRHPQLLNPESAAPARRRHSRKQQLGSSSPRGDASGGVHLRQIPYVLPSANHKESPYPPPSMPTFTHPWVDRSSLTSLNAPPGVSTSTVTTHGDGSAALLQERALVTRTSSKQPQFYVNAPVGPPTFSDTNQMYTRGNESVAGAPSVLPAQRDTSLQSMANPENLPERVRDASQSFSSVIPSLLHGVPPSSTQRSPARRNEEDRSSLLIDHSEEFGVMMLPVPQPSTPAAFSTVHASPLLVSRPPPQPVPSLVTFHRPSQATPSMTALDLSASASPLFQDPKTVTGTSGSTQKLPPSRFSRMSDTKGIFTAAREQRVRAQKILLEIKSAVALLDAAVTSQHRAAVELEYAVLQISKIREDVSRNCAEADQYVKQREEELKEADIRFKALMAEGLGECDDATLEELSDVLFNGLQSVTFAISQNKLGCVDSSEVAATDVDFFYTSLPPVQDYVPQRPKRLTGSSKNGKSGATVTPEETCKALRSAVDSLKEVQAAARSATERLGAYFDRQRHAVLRDSTSYLKQKAKLQSLEEELATRRREVRRLEGKDGYAGMNAEQLNELCKTINKTSRKILSEQAIREVRATEGVKDASGELRRQAEIESLSCFVCYEREWNTILQPCKHRLCEECAERLNFCPQCRLPISTTLKALPTKSDVVERPHVRKEIPSLLKPLNHPINVLNEDNQAMAQRSSAQVAAKIGSVQAVVTQVDDTADQAQAVCGKLESDSNTTASSEGGESA